MIGSFSTEHEIYCFLFGFIFIFIGDFIFGRMKSAKTASPFVRFFLATAFTYTAEIIKDIFCFIYDFCKGTAIQGYDRIPDKSLLFFSIFGEGKGDTNQYGLLFLNIGFIDMLVGCAVGGIILLITRSILARKKAVENE